MKPLAVYVYDMAYLVWLITFGIAPYEIRPSVGMFMLISMAAFYAAKASSGPTKAKRIPRHRKL